MADGARPLRIILPAERVVYVSSSVSYNSASDSTAHASGAGHRRARRVHGCNTNVAMLYRKAELLKQARPPPSNGGSTIARTLPIITTTKMWMPCDSHKQRHFRNREE